MHSTICLEYSRDNVTLNMQGEVTVCFYKGPQAQLYTLLQLQPQPKFKVSATRHKHCNIEGGHLLPYIQKHLVLLPAAKEAEVH